MIPAQAVEAAAKALYFYLDEDHRGAPAPWESLANDNDAKIDAMDAAHIALEAAAPHMLAAAKADAWDEATKAMVAAFASGERRLINPYRTTK